MTDDNIHFYVTNNVGLIVLDRPNMLNAISLKMARSIREIMNRWKHKSDLTHVVISSSSKKAFCAGGDVRYAYLKAQAEDFEATDLFFKTEYLMDLSIVEVRKPVIALCPGIVMGGGAGIAQHATYTIMTESTKFAMPESSIGLFPDAGASLFFGRCPPSVKLLLGITGFIIGAADCFALGLSTATVRDRAIEELKRDLIDCAPSEIFEVIRKYQIDVEESLMKVQSQKVDEIFESGLSVEEMQARAKQCLRQNPDDKLFRFVDMAFSHRCPMSMKVFARLVEESVNFTTPQEALNFDFFLAKKMTRRSDFLEGVRALLIDKDNSPQWSPSKLSEVSDDMIEKVFDKACLSPLR